MSKRYCQTLELKNDPELIRKYVEAHYREHHWSEIREGISRRTSQTSCPDKK